MRHKAKFILWPVVFLVAIAAMSVVVMLLWNAIVPALFASVPAITYLQALGLLVLCRILFGGLRGHGGWRGRMHGHGHERWAKWQAMTPEEREQFHRQRHEHGHGPR
jgi:ABC-type multidrug transport system fused ATPase/permease subunit